MVTPTGATQREFLTVVRYPVRTGSSSGRRFPLIVFGHGFDVTPAPYAPLLNAWTRSGYVVAAPVFPLGNARAPGGPNERDLVNQPGDVSLVISRLTELSARGSGPLAGIVDPREIAVSGQSDGGDTALAAAYDPAVRDGRIRAAMILSGAEDPFAPGFAMPRNGPPLLAVQGTADTINPPSLTYSFYDQAAPPKFLLKLEGAGHLPPYTVPGPVLSAVKRATLAFLSYYLRGRRRPLKRLLVAGTAGAGSVLSGSVGPS
jgi:fermentation-respiration switch protein FrsA (DUF1100 family)